MRPSAELGIPLDLLVSLVERGQWVFDSGVRPIVEGLRAVGVLTSYEQERTFLIAVARAEQAVFEAHREACRRVWEGRAARPWWKRWL